VHGDKDTLVPLEQSQWLKEALDKVGVECTLVVIAGGGHGLGGGDPQAVKKAQEEAVDFLDKHLKPGA